MTAGTWAGRTTAGLAGAAVCLWSVVWPPFVVANWAAPGWATTAFVSALAVAAALRWRLARPLVAACAVLSLAASAFLAVGTRNLVLQPAGPQGCRVVVVESAFLMGGGGDIGTIGHRVGFAHLQNQYVADDGGRPFSTGNFNLTWRGDQPEVMPHGTPGDPVYSAGEWKQLHC